MRLEIRTPRDVDPRIRSSSRHDSGVIEILRLSLAAVESGRGVAILPEVFHSLAGSRVKLRPIEPTPPPMIVGCAYTISSASTVAAQRFLTTIRSVAADRAQRLFYESEKVAKDPSICLSAPASWFGSKEAPHWGQV